MNKFDGQESVQVEANDPGRMVMLLTKIGSLGIVSYREW